MQHFSIFYPYNITEDKVHTNPTGESLNPVGYFRNVPFTKDVPLSLLTRLEIIWQGLAIRLDMYLHVLQLNIFIAKDESSPNQVAGIPTKEFFSPTKPT